MKKALSVALLGALALTAVGGTLAYFTDTDSADNVFTVGNVDIELHEDNGSPETDADYAKDEKYHEWLNEQEMMPGVAIKKEVTIENVGSQPTYLRVTIKVPTDMTPTWREGYTDAWTLKNQTTEGKNNVYVFELINPLASKATTENLLEKVTLNNDITSNNAGNYIVPVIVDAIQSAGFGSAADAYAQLDSALESANKQDVANLTEANSVLNAGGIAALENNIDVKGTDTVVMYNGGVLDGNGYTLNRTATNLTASTNGGVLTTGGTIKNITITGATATESNKDYGFRAVYVTAGLNSNLTIDNAKLSGTYALNITGDSSEYALSVKDSTLDGWVSYSKVASATFDNVDFITTPTAAEGDQDYNVLKPYCDTILTDCDFTDPYTLANGDKVEYITITMNNVKVGDTVITAENVATTFKYDNSFHGTIIIGDDSVFID